MEHVIQKAYELIGSPVDPNLVVPVEFMDIVDYKPSEAAESVEYFNTDHSGVDDIYAADAAGTITYHKIVLQTPIALTFSGLQSKMETILLDEIMNSKDQTAMASKKDGIIRAMDKEEARRVCNLVLAVPSQEVTLDTEDDILAGLIKMVQKVADYSTDYILLVGSTVMNAIDTYDIDNVATHNYELGIRARLATMGVKNIVKVIGEVNATPVLVATKAILVGRNSNLAQGRPIKFRRRKFSGQVAELAGAKEGDTRLVSIAKTPQVINAANANTLGYGCCGYESIMAVLTNYRAVAWCDELV